MSLELLLNQFDMVIRTPVDLDKLRSTIIQLGVQGKLVPQFLDDGSASEILKRSIETRNSLIKAGKIRKQKKLPPISIDEIRIIFLIAGTGVVWETLQITAFQTKLRLKTLRWVHGYLSLKI